MTFWEKIPRDLHSQVIGFLVNTDHETKHIFSQPFSQLTDDSNNTNSAITAEKTFQDLALESVVTSCTLLKAEIPCLLSALINCKTYPRPLKGSILFRVCAMGQLAVAQWLCERVTFNTMCLLDALRVASVRGHLLTSRWLAQHLLNRDVQKQQQVDQEIDHSKYLPKKGAQRCGNADVFTINNVNDVNDVNDNDDHDFVVLYHRLFPEDDHLLIGQRHKFFGNLSFLVKDQHKNKKILVKDYFETIFSDVCANGQLQAAKWLAKTFTFDYTEGAMVHACRNGQLAIVRWLAKKYHSGQIRDHQVYFMVSLRKGNLDLANWFYARYPLQPVTREYWYSVLTSPYDDCSPATARWLKTVLSLTRRDINKRDVLSKLCHFGNIPLLQWLIDELGANVRHMKNRHAQLAFLCGVKKVEMVQWLINKSYMDTREIRRSRILGPACTAGNLPFVQWLFANFKLTREDITRNSCEVLDMACRSLGTFEMVRWLVTHFHIRAEEIYSSRVNCLESACLSGNVPLTKWLYEYFHLPYQALQELFFPVLENLLNHRLASFDILAWMMQDMGVGEILSVQDLVDILDQAVRFSNFEFIKWMTPRLPPSCIGKLIASSGLHFASWLKKPGNLTYFTRDWHGFLE